jgi:hypothetical protein
MGGALLSVKGNATGPILHLVVAIDEKTADIKTRIARIVGMDRKRPKHYLYGVSFESDLSNSHHLKTIIDQARIGRWTAKTGTSDGEIRRNYWKL